MGGNCGVEESRRRKEVYESGLRNCFIGAVEGNAEMMTMKFEVCDVKKALAAVWRIAVKVTGYVSDQKTKIVIYRM